MDQPSVSKSLKTVYPTNDRLPEATSANVFHLAAFEGEIQLLVGSLSLVDLATSKDGETLTVNVSSRYLLSVPAFLRLKNAVDELAGKLNIRPQSTPDKGEA